MHMNMKVMKFGGTSLRSEATRKYVYRHVLESSKTNKAVSYTHLDVYKRQAFSPAEGRAQQCACAVSRCLHGFTSTDYLDAEREAAQWLCKGYQQCRKSDSRK